MSRGFAALLCSGAALGAVQELPDKSRYTLFHPTPAALLRPLSTDRPDVTESPRTVDSGHVQIEMDLVGFSYRF